MASSSMAPAGEHQTSSAQGKTYTELVPVPTSQVDNISSFSSSILERLQASTPRRDGDDEPLQTSLDLSALARDAGIPRDMENDE